MHLRPLPPEADELLLETKAPPRLRAHLALVHDVACQLTEQFSVAWPEIAIDNRAVHLGAATHDIGKTLHLKELSEPGNDHETAGQDLLIMHGWPENLSRFAVTHGRELTASDSIEDLLVALADKVWKGKRQPEFEEALMSRICSASGQEPWQVWSRLDDILTSLGDAASERLHWQGSHSL